MPAWSGLQKVSAVDIAEALARADPAAGSRHAIACRPSFDGGARPDRRRLCRGLPRRARRPETRQRPCLRRRPRHGRRRISWPPPGPRPIPWPSRVSAGRDAHLQRCRGDACRSPAPTPISASFSYARRSPPPPKPAASSGTACADVLESARPARRRSCLSRHRPCRPGRARERRRVNDIRSEPACTLRQAMAAGRAPRPHRAGLCHGFRRCLVARAAGIGRRRSRAAGGMVAGSCGPSRLSRRLPGHPYRAEIGPCRGANGSTDEASRSAVAAAPIRQRSCGLAAAAPCA